MNDQLDDARLVGARLVGPDQERIGRIGRVFPADGSGSPQWARVQMGLLGRAGSVVPLAGAEVADGDVRIPYTKDQVRDAPEVAGADGALPPAEEAALYRYYGLAAAGLDATDLSRAWVHEGSAPQVPGQATGGARAPRHALPATDRDDDELARAVLEADLYEAGRLDAAGEASPRRGKHVR